MIKEAFDITHGFTLERFAKESDGTFIGPKYMLSGLDSNIYEKKIYEKQGTTYYYYKTLVNESVSNKSKYNIKILTGNIDLSTYRNIIILINNKCSSISDIGTQRKRHIKNCFFSIDYNTLEINRNLDLERKTASMFNYKQDIFLSIVLCICITLIIKYIISKLFKIINRTIILKVNLLTQSILHIITITILSIFHMTYNTYIFIIVMLDIIVIISEILFYKRKIKDVTTKRLFYFSTISNICGFLVTPLIYMAITSLL